MFAASSVVQTITRFLLVGEALAAAVRVAMSRAHSQSSNIAAEPIRNLGQPADNTIQGSLNAASASAGPRCSEPLCAGGHPRPRCRCCSCRSAE